METVEKLLGGEGQSIRIGAPLLALSAWHLYPDMLVLGTTTKSIKQNDELMPIGSLVTLGLQGKDFTDKGIYWSLPLAHLRYYGDPVTSTSTLNLNGSRMSIFQLLQVALGAFLTDWGNDELMAAETLALVVDLVRDCPPSERFNLGEDWSSNWLGVLGDAAKDLLQSAEPQRSEYLKLFRAGRRRYQSILAKAESLPSVLGLTLPGGFIEMMKGPEERVRALRTITANNPHIADVVIQYEIDGRWECASAIPSESSILVISTKRKRDGSHVRYTPMTKFTRWLLRVKDPDLTSGAKSAINQRRKKHLENVEKLRQRAGHNSSERADESLFSRAVSLDNWEELLGSPADTAIVRAHGNWQARLAGMVLSIQRGHVTHVLPHEVCWICSLGGEKERESTETDEERTETDEESIEIYEEDDKSLMETDDSVSVENNERPSIVLIA